MALQWLKDYLDVILNPDRFLFEPMIIRPEILISLSFFSVASGPGFLSTNYNLLTTVFKSLTHEGNHISYDYTSVPLPWNEKVGLALYSLFKLRISKEFVLYEL